MKTEANPLTNPLTPGEWNQPRQRGYLFGCCDCGLVHRFDFRIVDGRVQFRLYREAGATRRMRRAMKRRK